MTARKPAPHSETAWMPINDSRRSRSGKPWFAVACLAHTRREARSLIRTDTTDWGELKKQGWRIVKVRIEVMTPGKVKAAKGTRR